MYVFVKSVINILLLRRDSKSAVNKIDNYKKKNRFEKQTLENLTIDSFEYGMIVTNEYENSYFGKGPAFFERKHHKDNSNFSK